MVPASASPVAAPRRSFARSRVGVLAVVVVGALAIGACGSTGTTTIATPDATGFTPKTDPTPVTAPDGTAPPTTGSSVPGTVTTLGKPTLTDASTISTVGLDKVHFGMTVAEAEQAAGSKFVSDTKGGSCFLAKPESGPDGVAFLISDGRIERVDISAGPIATRSGAKVGSTNAQIKTIYPGQIQDAARPDGQPGGALVYVPKDATDAQFRLVFMTDGTTVQGYRAGRVPQVLAATGCK